MPNILTFALAMVIIALGACAQATAPIGVQRHHVIGDTGVAGYTEIAVTALVDQVGVQTIKVNRGNCPTGYNLAAKDGMPDMGYLYEFGVTKKKHEEYPYFEYWANGTVTLKYGEQVVKPFLCDALEVEVQTTQGTWVFQPEQ